MIVLYLWPGQQFTMFVATAPVAAGGTILTRDYYDRLLAA